MREVLKLVAWLPLKLAESRVGGRAAAWAVRHVPRVLPVRWVARTPGALAMLHPIPQYPDHVVITPRVYVADLPGLVAGRHVEALRAMLDLARALDRARPPGGRLLTVSTGPRLHVKHVHGHLVAAADAFWLADDAATEVGRPPAGDPHAVLEAVAQALTVAGGGQLEGAVVFGDLGEPCLRVTATLAPTIAREDAEG